MARFIAELRVALPAAFEAAAYTARREALEEVVRERRELALTTFEARAREVGVAVIRTPLGIGLAMTRGDEVLPPDEFKTLPPDEQERRRADMARLEADLQVILRHLPTLEKEGREQLAALDREVVRATTAPLIARSGVRRRTDVVSPGRGRPTSSPTPGVRAQQRRGRARLRCCEALIGDEEANPPPLR
jgi:hypothetical protein